MVHNERMKEGVMEYSVVAQQSRADLLTQLRTEANSQNASDDLKFQEILGLCQTVLELSDQDIADLLRVSRPTVSRWVRGKNLPHRVMRKPILSWIAIEAGRRLARVRSQQRSDRYPASDEGRSFSSHSDNRMVAKAR
jgi:DNA-binding transcriptional regulator YiaG